MKEFVVDASVAIKWFVPEGHWAEASRLIDPDITLHAPDLFVAEMGNILWKKLRRREIDRQQAAAIVAAIGDSNVQLWPSSDLLPVAFDLAAALNHPVYDCLYLAAAIARNAAVVTADARFHAAVIPTRYARHVRWIEDAL